MIEAKISEKEKSDLYKLVEAAQTCSRKLYILKKHIFANH